MSLVFNSGQHRARLPRKGKGKNCWCLLELLGSEIIGQGQSGTRISAVWFAVWQELVYRIFSLAVVCS
jgi:hypothetical protein